MEGLLILLYLVGGFTLLYFSWKTLVYNVFKPEKTYTYTTQKKDGRFKSGYKTTTHKATKTEEKFQQEVETWKVNYKRSIIKFIIYTVLFLFCLVKCYVDVSKK